MAKVVDITEKLNFEESPKLKIKGKELTVHDDATTMLKVMQLMGGEAGVKEITQSYELMFGEKERKAIDSLGLKFNDFVVVIRSAIELITGETVGE
jgi:alpha-D-ribose 1-methylphosphonate 5-triphosphate synthase subunit PhnI